MPTLFNYDGQALASVQLGSAGASIDCIYNEPPQTQPSAGAWLLSSAIKAQGVILSEVPGLPWAAAGAQCTIRLRSPGALQLKPARKDLYRPHMHHTYSQIPGGPRYRYT